MANPRPVNGEYMHITSETVRDEHAWVRDREPVVVPTINDTRERLGRIFETDVDPITPRRTGARSMRCSRTARSRSTSRAASPCFATSTSLATTPDLSSTRFSAASWRRRSLGAPLSLLAQATFHFVDVHVSEDATADGAGAAGADDLDAALAAGFQTRLPGWDWREGESPFAVASPTDE